MATQKQIYALAFALHYERIMQLEGRKVPNQGRPFRDVNHFRWCDPLAEERQGARGKVYIARFQANLPEVGKRSIEIFGPLRKGISGTDARRQPETCGPRVEGRIWFRMALALWRGRIKLHRIEEAVPLPPPEKCQQENMFDLAYTLRRNVIKMPRLPQPPHISDYFDARAMAAELEKTKEGRAELRELARLWGEVRRRIPQLLDLDLLERIRSRLPPGFKAEA